MVKESYSLLIIVVGSLMCLAGMIGIIMQAKESDFDRWIAECKRIYSNYYGAGEDELEMIFADFEWYNLFENGFSANDAVIRYHIGKKELN